ncbi:condensation domain-containing protein [Streptomyces sp. NBC_01012]|uniref:condensation domain-containing protein n=1 Tax=Streptomyces sp. NBC_01012 TaxID=2903717 RepID=UPI00386E5A99|nr:condensation domain-containing protein [Streptomyces sp. NBC_01012]
MTAMGFVEEELARMWAEILDVTGVTLGSGWHALGGQPETVRTLAGLIDEELGAHVEPEGLLGADTLEGMARLVRDAMAARNAAARNAAARNAAAGPAADGPVGPRSGTRPERPALSFAQQRLWFMQQIDPGTTLYNVPTVLRLRGALDQGRLGRALTALVARHEVLRTVYGTSSGVPHQAVAAPAEFALPHTDLTGKDDPVAEAARIAADEGAHVFDLAVDPPLRAHLLRLGHDEHHLVVTFHHIAVDGWSVALFFRELGELYGDAGGGAATAPALQYADYADWQRDRLQGDTLNALTAHWRAVLGEDPQALAVPTDSPRTGQRSFRGAVVTRELGDELTTRIRAFGAGERSTLNMTLLAGFQALLAGWSGTDDVTVGIPVAGRTRPELQELIGCLINMVPVRVGLGGAPGFRGLLARTRTALLDASAHQELPFDKLVEALVSRRARDFLPVFRVMFSFLKEQPEPVFPGIDHCSLDLTGPQNTAKYDLSLYAQESGAGVALTLEYDTDLFGPETPAALLAAYEQTLHDAITFPDGPVLDLPAVRFRVSGSERNTHRDR